jgi:archaellum biogenesis ATPase FlaH
MEIENVAKQKLLIEYMLSSVDVFGLCEPIIHAKYFDVTLQKALNFILIYYNQYNSIASLEQVEAESGTKFTKHELTTDQTRYALTEVESFCKKAAIRQAILDSVELYNKGDYGKIESNLRDAITTSVFTQAGVGLFEDRKELLERLKQHPALASGYTEFDNILGGGLRRKELLLFSANSGGGKSIMMANFGLNYLINHGLRVLYLSFELPEEMIAKRFFSMVTSIEQTEITNREIEIDHMMEQIRQNIQKQTGVETVDIHIERLPSGTTPNRVRGFLREYILRRGFPPDLIILDYLDLMNPNEKVSADNVHEKDKQVTEQVCEILVDYNMIGISASQQNRSAVTTSELNHSHIAGGISKINTTDIYASIIFNNVMRAAGEIHLEFLKTRSAEGVGKRVELKWERKALRVENPPGIKPLTFVGKSSDNKSGEKINNLEQRSSRLSDLIDI